MAPKNYYGHDDPDYDAGVANRDFGILTTQDGHKQRLWIDESGMDPDVVSNVRQNNPPPDPFAVDP